MQAYHLQDVGKILLQAQQDLKSMRESVQLNENIEQRDIDDVLKKAEENLKVKAKVGNLKADCSFYSVDIAGWYDEGG